MLLGGESESTGYRQNGEGINSNSFPSILLESIRFLPLAGRRNYDVDAQLRSTDPLELTISSTRSHRTLMMMVGLYGNAPPYRVM